MMNPETELVFDFSARSHVADWVITAIDLCGLDGKDKQLRRALVDYCMRISGGDPNFIRIDKYEENRIVGVAGIDPITWRKYGFGESILDPVTNICTHILASLAEYGEVVDY